MCYRPGVLILLLLNSSKIITVRVIEAVMALDFMSRIKFMLSSFGNLQSTEKEDECYGDLILYRHSQSPDLLSVSFYLASLLSVFHTRGTGNIMI